MAKQRVFTHPSCGGELAIVQVGSNTFRFADSNHQVGICLGCNKTFPIARQIAPSLKIVRLNPVGPQAAAIRQYARFAPLLNRGGNRG